ncbi:MAG: hypothetical protein QW258_01145 [Thermoplasmata archaeon]
MIKVMLIIRHNSLLYTGGGLIGAGIGVFLETAVFPTSFINNLLGMIIFTLFLVSGLILIYRWKKYSVLYIKKI